MAELRNGLVRLPTEDSIRELAYFKFLNGNHDPVQNWLEAERELNHIHYRVQHTTQYDYNI